MKRPSEEERRKLIQTCEAMLRELERLEAEYDASPPGVQKLVDEMVRGDFEQQCEGKECEPKQELEAEE